MVVFFVPFDSSFVITARSTKGPWEGPWAGQLHSAQHLSCFHTSGVSSNEI